MGGGRLFKLEPPPILCPKRVCCNFELMLGECLRVSTCPGDMGLGLSVMRFWAYSEGALYCTAENVEPPGAFGLGWRDNVRGDVVVL